MAGRSGRLGQDGDCAGPVQRSGIEAVGSDSTSYALSVVQNIPRWNTELWLTWRAYDYSEPETEFDSASAFFVGGRFKF